ncbi:unnamed protein product [Rotaria magnacalcarata]|uniref:Uncharacterized protein n=3 Tax=Rotaria magnacalcarata TaxID=392030 RepID=A0A816UDX0_9BILA|nr:unnamed protein product [Rotaria magnacalcarata]CAF2101373.1 unnamed protein product [Rotaria magnacalcarata]CAF2117111.1 unnamed protein product [Rotaria magnacalcarata]CAF3764980.1 unnamed protein product [Rotaria magnacalcarata]CAF3829435.1 unnamed protein product [Rotaria magnacalcarata]
MAQRNAMSTRDESTSTKQQTSSARYQSSFSQPTPSTISNEEKSNRRRRLTLPVPLNNNSSLSKAERYIILKSLMLSSPDEQTAISPETLSSKQSGISPMQCPPSHNARMQQWYQGQAYNIAKKEKYRYVYGPPLSSPARTPTSLSESLFSTSYSKPISANRKK